MSKNNIGDLKVWAIRNGKEDFYSVNSPENALQLIGDMADADLKNDDIDYNCFGLLVYDGYFEDGNNGWSEWHNDDGDCIDDLMRKD